MRYNQQQAVNPHMVILGRESRGLSQKVLAERLHVTQGRISKMESGLLPIPDDILDHLSEALNYPKHFFFQEGGTVGIGIAEIFHRKRQNVPKHVLDEIYAQIELRIKNITALLRSVDIACSIPIIDIDELDGRVDEIARTVRTHLQLPRGPILDLTETLEDAGVIIFSFDFGTRLIDAISRWVPRLPPLFFMNQYCPKDRWRFSLAHELGHMVMHAMPTGEMEAQADRFAQEFLMPERDIIADLRELDLAKLANLKRYWKVSMAALLKRAESLNSVSPNQARYLWVQISKAGYKTREPAELDVEGEHPHLIDEMIGTFQNELGYSQEDFQEILPLFDEELFDFYLQDHNRPQPRLRLVK